jgi:hypothetical protein
MYVITLLTLRSNHPTKCSLWRLSMPCALVFSTLPYAHYNFLGKQYYYTFNYKLFKNKKIVCSSLLDPSQCLWDMGNPGFPPTRFTAVPDKWFRPTRRPTDLSVGPTDLVGGPHDLLKTFQKIPKRPNQARPQDLAYKTRHRWIPTKAYRWDMARVVT